MKLFTAIVTSVFDPLDPTVIHCKIIGSNADGGESEPVMYTSPFNRSTFISKGAGLTAYPAKGDMVLIARADNDPSYFYMSTITGVGQPDLSEGVENYPAEDLSELDSLKRSLSYRDNIGGALDMVDKSSEVLRRSYVKLSNGPESITLNRQYQNESIHLRCRGGDTQIRMNAPRKFSGVDHGPGSMLVQGERNTVVKTKKGNLRLEAAAEARSIKIKNNAFFIGLSTSNLTDPFSGSVTVESLYNQICLRTYGFGPQANPFNGIFFQAGLIPGPVPAPDPSVLPTGGVIQSHAGQTNQMLCGQGVGFGIKMNTISQTLDIQAPGGINITTAGALNINGSLINMQLPGFDYASTLSDPLRVITPATTNLDAQPPIPGAG